mmetsp:Transcript_6602/g.15795  ORF Transcript_6602/g.15795 Transcript_6602/m.15795 type:complete len:207 (-) Transcript_6602:659-1279(-)
MSDPFHVRQNCEMNSRTQQTHPCQSRCPANATAKRSARDFHSNRPLARALHQSLSRNFPNPGVARVDDAGGRAHQRHESQSDYTAIAMSTNPKACPVAHPPTHGCLFVKPDSHPGPESRCADAGTDSVVRTNCGTLGHPRCSRPCPISKPPASCTWQCLQPNHECPPKPGDSPASPAPNVSADTTQARMPMPELPRYSGRRSVAEL